MQLTTAFGETLVQFVIRTKLVTWYMCHTPTQQRLHRPCLRRVETPPPWWTRVSSHKQGNTIQIAVCTTGDEGTRPMKDPTTPTVPRMAAAVPGKHPSLKHPTVLIRPFHWFVAMKCQPRGGKPAGCGRFAPANRLRPVQRVGHSRELRGSGEQNFHASLIHVGTRWCIDTWKRSLSLAE